MLSNLKTLFSFIISAFFAQYILFLFAFKTLFPCKISKNLSSARRNYEDIGGHGLKPE